MRGIGTADVHISSAVNGWKGIYGQHTVTTGYGVVGDGKGLTGAGVLARNTAGDGVRGEGKIRVHATSTSGGYGALIEGGKAQLRIVPKITSGKPTTGAHSKGELFLDSAVTYWICTVAGSPGTWRKVVSTTAT